MSRRSLPRRLFRFTCALLLLLVCTTVASVALLRWVDPPTSAFIIRERLIAAAGGEKREIIHHRWVDGRDIPGPMKVAVIAAEDQTFAHHNGFDLESINDAIEERMSGGRVRGASTISQQTAKNLFLWPDQSWLRKGLEAYFTVLIELLWSKQRILEVYLNIAEFGKGVFGVGAAADVYFHKPVARLSGRDAALLAAVLPSPTRLHVDEPSNYVRSRQEWIMTQMRRLGGTAVLKGMEESG